MSVHAKDCAFPGKWWSNLVSRNRVANASSLTSVVEAPGLPSGTLQSSVVDTELELSKSVADGVN